MTEGYSISSINNNIKLAILHLPDYAVFTGLSAKRELEKSATLFLLEKLFNKQVQLEYNAEGKPLLREEKCHISISHSHDKLVIICNTQCDTGVDVELVRDKVLKIKDKFLSDIELEEAKDNVEKLIIYWAAKETLYKVYGLKEVEFAKHLYVNPFELKAVGELIGEINLESFRKKFNLHYEKLEDYMLVYVLDELK
ncbi:MAG: 4'-phosphopantetheinyl transferase superfamily protein [Bacteroidia bacterium]|nr:4'-phosphopantetheinyl transferase superfamily protein [Bacteroidia bacterium]